jgi:periplasmic protein TonB
MKKKLILAGLLIFILFNLNLFSENLTDKSSMNVNEYMETNINTIVTLLKENLNYPRAARKRGISGTVILNFSLSKKAKISDIKIIKSNHKLLSIAAIKSIKNLDNKLPKPSERIYLTLPIKYTIPIYKVEK